MYKEANTSMVSLFIIKWSTFPSLVSYDFKPFLCYNSHLRKGDFYERYFYSYREATAGDREEICGVPGDFHMPGEKFVPKNKSQGSEADPDEIRCQIQSELGKYVKTKKLASSGDEIRTCAKMKP